MVQLDKKQIIILGAIAIIVVLVIGIYFYNHITQNNYEQMDIYSENAMTENKESVEKQEEKIVIHIAGQVKKPGVIRIKEGARIADIIEQAGGLNEEADITNINLAYPVEDGQKVIIPKKGEKLEEYETDKNDNLQREPSTKQNEKINLNKASKEELEKLQGIGEQTAQKIIDYRKTNGDFKQIEDIKNVEGIGDTKYENIKNFISIK